jgi:small conductance mechanosensitive channel
MKSFLFALALMFSIIATAALAQQSPPAAATSDPMGALLDVMKDETLRNELIRKLEESRGQPPEAASEAAKPAVDKPAADKPAAAAAAAVADVFSNKGLATGLLEWLRDLQNRLPSAALGAPIDDKFRQAGFQIERRLSTPDMSGQLRDIGLRWVPGWLVGTLAGIATLVLVRRRIRARVARSSTLGHVAREAALRGGIGLLPLVACLMVVLTWTALVGLSQQGGIVFFVLCMPFVMALTASELTSSLLLLLAPSKGWRLVAYAQRRLSPVVGLLVGVATGATVMLIPELGAAIGPATADIAKLVLDLAVPLIALFIILRDRRIVRALIVRGHVPEEDSSPLDRAIYRVGSNWHRLGIIFVVLNIGARLFGAETGGFLVQSFLSVAIIVLALILSTTLRRLSEEKETRYIRPGKRGVQRAVFMRAKSILFKALQFIVSVSAVVICLDLWGVDILAWARSQAGLSVLGPLASIGVVLLTAWTLWVILDAWISHALSPDHATGGRPRSARIMTLLPLLRNFAFVALSVLTIMGVLSNVGINIAPLIAGAGVVGLAIGFGSQQLVQDVITGLFILLEDTIAIGDTISTGDRTGTVEALTIRTVKIRDGDGALHSIPFSTIKALKNSSRGFGVYTVSVTIDTDADVERAINVMKDAGNEVRKDPKFASRIIGPFDVSGIDQIGLDGIVVKGSIKTRPLQQYGVGNELNRRVRDALQRAGVPLARRSLPPMVAEGA